MFCTSFSKSYTRMYIYTYAGEYVYIFMMAGQSRHYGVAVQWPLQGQDSVLKCCSLASASSAAPCCGTSRNNGCFSLIGSLPPT